MNPMHQLTRRPVKAAFGALLLALAGVILALSGGQFWAAVQTRAGVEETYTTVAVVTGGKRQLVSSGDIVYEDIGPTYEANEFLKEAAQKGWSIIRGQATMGLAGETGGWRCIFSWNRRKNLIGRTRRPRKAARSSATA